jgi:predicted transglutaminase-like cysteine proteinase
MVQIYDIPSHRITEETIKKMHELVRKAKTDYEFINLIRDMVKGCPAKDSMCEMRTVYNSFKKTIRYILDPAQLELISSVWETMKNRAGDCDDFAILLSASAGAIGLPYRFVTIRSDPTRPNEDSHIWTQVLIKNSWIDLDPTVKEFSFGQSAPEIYRRKYWEEPVW